MIRVAGISLGWPFETAALAIIEAYGTVQEYLIPDEEPEYHVQITREVPIEGPPVRMKLRYLEQFKPRIGYEEIVHSAREKMLKVAPVLFALECTKTGYGALDLFDRLNLPPTVGVVLSKTGVAGEGGRIRTLSAEGIVNRLRLAIGERRFTVAGMLRHGRAVLDSAMAPVDKAAELDASLAAVTVAVWLAELELCALAEAQLSEVLLGAAMRTGGVRISPV